MEITLRNKTYKAEHLTDTNYLALSTLFIDDEGHFLLEGIEDSKTLPSATQLKLTQPLMKKLIDPDNKAAIAHSISAIFPSLPRDLVRYNGKGDFAMNLTLQELLEVTLKIGNALNEQKPSPTQEELARAANIARLEEELAQLKTTSTKGKGFG